MRSKLFYLLLLGALLVSACTPQATPIAATDVPAVDNLTATAVPPTAELTTPPEPKNLTVLAAASLTESFTEIGKEFENQNPGVTVTFSFAGSQQLAQQLGQGAEADVFASASKKYMDQMVEAGIVKQEDAATFARNRLVVIYPIDNPAGLTGLKDLTKAGVKIDLADKSVPVGQYSLDFLDKAVNDPEFGATYKDDVLNNVVSYEENVKAVLTKVSLGEADAGIVYVTDITPDAAGKVGRIDIPDELNTIATYPLGTISASKEYELAKTFTDFVLSASGQQILANYGFVPAVQSETGGSFTVTDALGRTVTFEKPPQRIVLTGKALFMIADAIYLFPEAGERVVALGSTTQGTGNFIPLIDSSFDSKMKLDSSAGPEQVAAAQPDCVIMKSTNAETTGKAIEELNIPVVYLDFETSEQYQRDLATLGQLFQNPEQAARLAAYYQNKVKAISDAVSGVKEEEKPKTLLLYYSDKDGNVAFNVPPMSWMQTYLVQTAGGKAVWEDANPGGGWTKVSLEQVAAWDPDTIFLVAYFNPVNDIVNNLKADPQWQSLKAVKNNQIFGFATDVYSWDQPDTRWILGLSWVASKLHPDLFPGYDAKAAAQEFYQDLYGMSAEDFTAKIAPLFTGAVE